MVPLQMTIRQPVKGAAAFSKTIAVLQLVSDSERPPTSIELVKKTGIPRPTMRRILKALIAEDMLQLHQDKTYVLGARNIEFARKAIDQNCLLQAIDTDLDWLSERADSEVYLGIPCGHEFIFIAGEDNIVQVGKNGPYHACAIAKSYLANIPEDQREQIVESIGMPSLTQYTPQNPDELRLELNQALQAGYAVSDQQLMYGFKGFGACISDAGQTPCGGIGFLKPIDQLDANRESNLVGVLLQCRDRIHQNLRQAGYNRPQRSI